MFSTLDAALRRGGSSNQRPPQKPAPGGPPAAGSGGSGGSLLQRTGSVADRVMALVGSGAAATGFTFEEAFDEAGLGNAGLGKAVGR